MKILITGSTGNVGKHLVNFLEDKHQIIGINRGDEKPDKYVSFTVDLSNDPEAAAKIILYETPDVVIHLAALVGSKCTQSPDLARRINVDATRHLAEAAVMCKVKTFMLFSTSAVYHQTELAPTDEAHNIDPVSVYGNTKLAAERVIENVSKATNDTKFVTLRPFNIYGMGFDFSLVNMLLNSTSSSPVTLFGYNNLIRDYIHISDIVKSVQLTMKHNFSKNYTVMNIGTGVPRSNARVIEELQNAGKPIYFTMSQADILDVSLADISLAKSEIGLKPSENLILK